jgi:hypothetical protein
MTRGWYIGRVTHNQRLSTEHILQCNVFYKLEMHMFIEFSFIYHASGPVLRSGPC